MNVQLEMRIADGRLIEGVFEDDEETGEQFSFSSTYLLL